MYNGDDEMNNNNLIIYTFKFKNSLLNILVFIILF